MLTEKDYCDLDTSHELWVMGLEPEAYYDGPLILLYEAQKWLREEKNIIVYPEKNSIGWFYTTHYNIGNVHRFKYSEEYYDSYEETLSEGVKCAVKILKENETIHE